MQPRGPYRNFPQSCYTKGMSATPDIDDVQVPPSMPVILLLPLGRVVSSRKHAG